MRLSAAAVGADGFKMLFISLLVILGSGGLSLLWSLYHVLRVGSEATCRADSVTTVLVPGVRLVGGEVDDDFRLRLQRALVLYQAGIRELLLLGGVTGPGGVSEAAKGAEYLVARGVPRNALRLEEGSRHTLENLRHARELLGAAAAVAIVSNRYHLARLGVMATGLGMPHVLCAAESGAQWPIRRVGRLLLEAFYVHWYLTGRYWARLVRDRASQSRIS
ncbi:MAG: YdcF family protein [Pseudomonadota bacterium]